MLLPDFDFELPPELIAQSPAAERTASRMLHLDGVSGALADKVFTDIAMLVRPEDVMVFNDTRVIKARLTGSKDTGGKVEVLVERVLTQGERGEVLAQVRASHAPREGSVLMLSGGARATVLGREGEFFRLRNTGCPYRTTASETHACCAADRRAIELLLGAPVEQITTVAGGGAACEYLVAKHDDERPVAGNGLLPVLEQKGTASAR